MNQLLAATRVTLAAALISAASPARGAEKSLSAEGYLHLQWRADYADRSDSAGRRSTFHQGFVLRRGRVKFRYGFDDRVRTELELGCDKLELRVKDAFVEYRAAPYLLLKAGLYKTPFSLEELTPASRLVLAERSVLNDRFDDQGFLGRDIGFSVSGRLLERGLPLSYELGVFNGNRAGGFRDNDNAKQLAGRLTVTPLARLTVGANAAQRNDSLTGRLTRALGADVAWHPGSATFEVEALHGDADTDRTMSGARLLGACRAGRLEPAAQYALLATKDADLSVEHEAAVGLGWTINRRLFVKFNAAVLLRPDSDTRAWGLVQVAARF